MKRLFILVVLVCATIGSASAQKKEVLALTEEINALKDREEAMHRQKLAELKAEQGIVDGEFYHYDIPLTVKHETEALLEAGFSNVQVLNHWGATYTLKAVK